MHSEKGTIDMLNSAIGDINALIIQGAANWKHALNACGKIKAVVDNLEKMEAAREEAYSQSIEDAKKRREQQLKEAAEKGETVIGGQTIEINPLTGEQKTIIE